MRSNIEHRNYLEAQSLSLLYRKAKFFFFKETHNTTEFTEYTEYTADVNDCCSKVYDKSIKFWNEIFQ